MKTRVTNKEFRDASKESSYPLTVESTMSSKNGVKLPYDLLLDALIHPISEFEAPYYISSIRGSLIDGEAAVTITILDNNKNTVGTCTTNKETGYILDSIENIIGTLVFFEDRLNEFIGAATREPLVFSTNALVFQPSCCFSCPAKGLMSVVSNGTGYKNEVYICGSNGVNFSLNGSDIEVNLYGEEKNINPVVKSINGVNIKELWLAAYPGKEYGTGGVEGSAIRVRTESNKIILGKGRDFTYGE